MPTQTTETEAVSSDALSRLFEDLRANVREAGTLGDSLGVSKADLEALYILGTRLYGLGRYKEAAINLRRLVSLEPYERRYLQALGACMQMQGQYEEALVHYGVCFMLDVEDPVTPFHMAQCLVRLQRRSDALALLEAVMDNAGGKPEHRAMHAQAQAMHQLLQAAPQEPTP